MAWICSSCNVQSPTKYCPRCGSECLTVEVTESRQESRAPAVQKTSKKTKTIVVMAVGIVGLSLIIGGGMYLKHSSITKTATSPAASITITKPADKTESQPQEKPAAPEVVPPAPKAKNTGKNTVVKKQAPRQTKPQMQQTPTPNTPWRYRVETPQAQPAPQQPRQQAQRPPQPRRTGNPLGDLIETFMGPAPDVTPPPQAGDAKNGM